MKIPFDTNTIEFELWRTGVFTDEEIPKFASKLKKIQQQGFPCYISQLIIQMLVNDRRPKLENIADITNKLLKGLK